MYCYILGAHVIASSLPPFLTLPPSLFAHPSLPSCLPLRLAPSCRLGLLARAALSTACSERTVSTLQRLIKEMESVKCLCTLYQCTLFCSP